MFANFFKTQGHNKAAKYWAKDRCGKKAALCPWPLERNIFIHGIGRTDSTPGQK